MEGKILAISGFSGTNFEQGFWSGVQERKGNQPIRGSIGVFWHIYRDLKKLIPSVPETEDLKPNIAEGLKNVLKDTYHLNAASSKGLAEFYTFGMDSGQSLFFIKKGTKRQWLVRKTGPYYYDERIADPLWYPHRIPFEFVRDATQEEGIAILGKGMNTLLWVPYIEPKIDAPILSEMPRKKKEEVVEETKVEEKPKRTRKKAEPKAKPKAEPEPKTEPKLEIPISPYIEAVQEPHMIEETVIVKISVFEHDRTLYFRDSVKNKLYTYESPTDVGAYIGRWCPHSLSVITDVPDSDLED